MSEEFKITPEQIKQYQIAAKKGLARAQYNLGVCYYNGYGVPKDYSKAVYWYTKSAEQGDAYAQCNIGFCYKNGYGVPKDYNKAVYWYTKSAEQGNADAIEALKKLNREKTMSEEFKGTPEQIKQYQIAAEQGNATAQYNLGVCYYNGQGVAQDNKKAVYWFTKSAEQGNADAIGALKKLNRY